MRAALQRFATPLPLLLFVPLVLLAAGPSRASEIRYAVPPGDSPSIGPASAPVTLVEFVDYQ